MKSFVLFFLSALLVAAAASSYDDIKDVNLEELLADDVRRKAVFDCVMDLAPCAPEHQVYKDVIPALVESECEKCTPEQKERYEHSNKVISEKYPEEFQAVHEKYGKKKIE